MFKTRAVAVFAILSLALGIGANTAIYSFMDAILLRSLPIADPDSLVVMSWRSKPFSIEGQQLCDAFGGRKHVSLPPED